MVGNRDGHLIQAFKFYPPLYLPFRLQFRYNNRTRKKMQEITDSSIPDGGTVEYRLINPPPPGLYDDLVITTIFFATQT